MWLTSILFSLAAIADRPVDLGPLPTAPPATVRDVAVVGQGRLLVAAERDGFVAFDEGRGQWRVLEAASGKGSATALHLTEEGTVWAIRGCTLSKYGPGGWTHKPQAKGSAGCPLSLAGGPEDSVWVGLERGIGQLVDGQLKVQEMAGEVPLNKVGAIAADHDGNVWVGTSGGLSLIPADGEATHWTTEQGLADNRVLALATDFGNRVLVGTRKGLSRWDPAEEDWEDLLLDVRVSDIVVGPDQTWVATDDGVYQLTGDKEPVARRYGLEDGLPSSTILSVFSRGAVVWIGTDGGGSARFEPASDRFVAWSPPSSQSAQRSRNQLAVATDGGVWIGTAGGLLHYDPLTDTRTPVTSRAITSLAIDGSDIVWAAGAASLFSVEASSGVLSVIPSEAGKGVRAMAVGPDGAVWLVGRTGLHRYTPADGTWQKLDAEFPADLGAIVVDERGATLGGGDGLLTYELESGKLEAVDGGPEEGVRTLAWGPDGTLLVGTFGDAWRRTADGWTSWSEEEGLTEGTVNAVLETDSVLWLGHFEAGLTRIDLASQELTAVPPTDGLRDGTVRSLASGSDGWLWVGTDSGPQAYHHETGAWRHIVDRLATPAEGVDQLIEADDGALWMIADGGGALRFDRPTQQWARFMAADGLADDSVNDVWPDSDGGVWFATDSGLSHRDPDGLMTTRVPAFGADRIGQVVRDGTGALWALVDQGELHRQDPATGTWSRIRETREGQRLYQVDDGVWVELMPEPDPESMSGFPEPVLALFGADGEVADAEGAPPASYAMVAGMDEDASRWVARDDGLIRVSGAEADGSEATETRYRPSRNGQSIPLMGGAELAIPSADTAVLHVGSQSFGQPSSASTVIAALHTGSGWDLLTGAGTVHVVSDDVMGALVAPVTRASAMSRHADRLCVGGETLACTTGGDWSEVELPGELGTWDTVSALYETEAELWIGATNGELCRIPVKGKPACVQNPEAVRTIIPASSGRIWVGTGGGVMRVRGKGSKVIVERILDGPDVLSMLVDGDTLLVASADGLQRLDPDTETWTVLDNGYVRAVATGTDGQIWFARGGHVWELTP